MKMATHTIGMAQVFTMESTTQITQRITLGEDVTIMEAPIITAEVTITMDTTIAATATIKSAISELTAG